MSCALAQGRHPARNGSHSSSLTSSPLFTHTHTHTHVPTHIQQARLVFKYEQNPQYATCSVSDPGNVYVSTSGMLSLAALEKNIDCALAPANVCIYFVGPMDSSSVGSQQQNQQPYQQPYNGIPTAEATVVVASATVVTTDY